MIILYEKASNTLIVVDKDHALDNLYYFKANFPSKEQVEKYLATNRKPDDITNFFRKNSIHDGFEIIKHNLSTIESQIPLYDARDENLYLIDKDSVFEEVLYQNRRFPTKTMYNEFVEKYKNMDPTQIKDVLEKRKHTKLGYMIGFWLYLIWNCSMPHTTECLILLKKATQGEKLIWFMD